MFNKEQKKKIRKAAEILWEARKKTKGFPLSDGDSDRKKEALKRLLEEKS